MIHNEIAEIRYNYTSYPERTTWATNGTNCASIKSSACCKWCLRNPLPKALYSLLPIVTMRFSAVHNLKSAAVLSLSLLIARCSAAATGGMGRTAGTFKSQILNNTSLRYVKNSGVCETTPGVEQVSGYIDVGTNMSMVRLSDFTTKCFSKIVHNLVVLVLRS
jgi:hypothetical protein